MARPPKQGLDYFPHDTDANSDEKIRALKSLHGMSGCGVYWELIEKIYRSEQGYLCFDVEWKIAVYAGDMYMTVQQLTSVIASMLDIGLFNKDIYEKEKKLTSIGLMKRRENLLYHRNYMRELRASKKPLTPDAEKAITRHFARKYPESARYAANQASAEET